MIFFNEVKQTNTHSIIKNKNLEKIPNITKNPQLKCLFLKEIFQEFFFIFLLIKDCFFIEKIFYARKIVNFFV